jgi:hypothetical protein
MWTIILYRKPGCHLCEGLEEKLSQIQDLEFELEIRNILTQPEWFQAYQYEIPVLHYRRSDEPDQEINLPRPSPRLTVAQLHSFLATYLQL